MRVTYVITGLGSGGAEWALSRIAGRLSQMGFVQHVISLNGSGPVADALRGFGISVEVCQLDQGPLAVTRKSRLKESILHSQPDVVQSWMYHADLMSSFALKDEKVPLVWGLRNSTLESGTARLSTRLVRKWCAKLSHKSPRAIVSCSKVAAVQHIELGYAKNRIRVIPNGIATDTFRKDTAAGQDLRRRLSIPNDAFLFGHAARSHPQKGHDVCLQAAAELVKERPAAYFVFCGTGVDVTLSPFHEFVERNGAKNFRFVGPQSDMVPFYNACQSFVMSSIAGEAFPNVLAEAMACGVPCIATNVGDASYIVGETGRMVPPKDASSLGNAMRSEMDILPQDRLARSAAANRRIVETFEIRSIAKEYARLYEEIVNAACAA